MSCVVSSYPGFVMFQFVFSFIFPRFLEVDHPDGSLAVVIDEEERAADDLVC